MEIKLTKDQQESLKLFVEGGIPEKIIIKQLIDIGLLFYFNSPARRKIIMALLRPD